MVGAYVFINVKPGKIESIITSIKKARGVNEAHIVTGNYDIIVSIKADNLNDLGKLIMEGVQNLEGVSKTVTCLTVK